MADPQVKGRIIIRTGNASAAAEAQALYERIVQSRKDAEAKAERDAWNKQVQDSGRKAEESIDNHFRQLSSEARESLPELDKAVGEAEAQLEEAQEAYEAATEAANEAIEEANKAIENINKWLEINEKSQAAAGLVTGIVGAIPEAGIVGGAAIIFNILNPLFKPGGAEVLESAHSGARNALGLAEQFHLVHAASEGTKLIGHGIEGFNILYDGAELFHSGKGFDLLTNEFTLDQIRAQHELIDTAASNYITGQGPGLREAANARYTLDGHGIDEKFNNAEQAKAKQIAAQQKRDAAQDKLDKAKGNKSSAEGRAAIVVPIK